MAARRALILCGDARAQQVQQRVEGRPAGRLRAPLRAKVA